MSAPTTTDATATRPAPAARPDVELMAGYHSPQVDVEVRLNTNESPEAPPPALVDAVIAGLADLSLHRYPDREARALRQALADRHGVAPEQVWCGNGSNEVLQATLLAYGGPGRPAAVFEPTYALHSHISRITGTPVLTGARDESWRVRIDELERLAEAGPAVMFLCSPNNPTGVSEELATIAGALELAPGLVVVDEAYAQFAPNSMIDVAARGELRPDLVSRLVVVRTFSKTWALAGLRLGYAVADPEVIAALAKVTLPYHIDSLKQLTGRLSVGFEAEMRARIVRIVESRSVVTSGLDRLGCDVWPSEANFVLFRPPGGNGQAVWQGLLERSVLVRNVSGWPGLEGCLRVTIGTAAECARFLDALAEVVA